MHSIHFQTSSQSTCDPDVDNLFFGIQNNPYFKEMQLAKAQGPTPNIFRSRMHKKPSQSPSPPSVTIVTHPPGTPNLEIESNPTEYHTKPRVTTAPVQIPPVMPKPSALRISTMTAISSCEFTVDLKKFYEVIDFTDIDTSQPYLQTCQYGGQVTKGLDVKVKTKRAKAKKKKDCFQNQATVVVNLADGNRVNLKIFRNGKLQMTGLKSKEGGILACKTLIANLQRLQKTYPDLVTFHTENPTPSDFNIVLINSDFSVGFKIKRDELYQNLFHRNIFVSYEPDIYPGVNAKYYYNTMYDNNGVCKCTAPCDGKGNGHGNGKCKKVTIATFQSGNIIITGARTDEQTDAAYKFINRVFQDNYHSLIRVTNMEDDTLPHGMNNPKTIKIKLSDIENYAIREELLKHIHSQK